MLRRDAGGDDIQTQTDLARWKEYDHRCPRCGTVFREVNNIGTWQCVQPLIGHPGVFVRADHAQDHTPSHYRYTALNDKQFSRVFFGRLTQAINVPIVPASHVTLADALPLQREFYTDLIDHRNYVVLRRYDFRTEALYLGDQEGVSGAVVYHQDYFFPGPGKLVLMPREK